MFQKVTRLSKISQKHVESTLENIIFTKHLTQLFTHF